MPRRFFALPLPLIAIAARSVLSQIYAVPLPLRFESVRCNALANLRGSSPHQSISSQFRGHASRITTLPCPRCAVHCQRKLLQCLFSANLSYTVAMQCFAKALLSLALPSLCPSMPSHIETSQYLSHSTPVPSISMPCHAFASPRLATPVRIYTLPG